MNTQAYNTWIDLFDDDLSKTWQEERKELQKAAMLLNALRKEFKRVYSEAENEFAKLKCSLTHNDSMSPVRKTSVSKNTENKENVDTPKTPPRKTFSPDIASPDLLQCVNENISDMSETVIDLSISDDDPTQTSPTLNMKRKKSRKEKVKGGVKREALKVAAIDYNESVIEGTPDTTKSRLSKKVSKREKRKKNSTLTQLFPNRSHLNTNKDRDPDETRIEEEKTELGITSLIDYLNANKRENESILKELESKEEDGTASLDEFDIDSPKLTSPKKPKLQIQDEPIVRGKARKHLTGFSCHQCKNFYGAMKLSPDELQKRMDECSRHRYKFQPRCDTIPGYWDLSINSQNIREVNDDK